MNLSHALLLVGKNYQAMHATYTYGREEFSETTPGVGRTFPPFTQLPESTRKRTSAAELPAQKNQGAFKSTSTGKSLTSRFKCHR